VKLKKTLVLVAAFAALLAFVLVFESREKKAGMEKEKSEKLVDLASADVTRVQLKREDERLTFEKNEKGEWTITEPVAARADSYEVNNLVEGFADLSFEKIVEEQAADPSVYEIPKKEILLWVKGQDTPVSILTGMENPIDKTYYAKRGDEARVVLIAGNKGTILDKKLLDFRDKSAFKFETGEVKAMKVRTKDAGWEVRQTGDGWFFDIPFKALAKKSSIDSMISALSNLRAKEFLSEAKTPQDLENFGLDEPAYRISLSLPAAGKTIVFALSKRGDDVYASSSDSDKIISCDSYVLGDFDKPPSDLREKQVAQFSSWEVEKLDIRRGETVITAVRQKDDQEGERWFSPGDEKKELDKAKVDELIRKLEYLQAAGFIDQPGPPSETGLDQPQAEITILTQETEGGTSEVKLLVGKEITDKKQLILKNARLDYLFLVEPSLLDQIPKEAGDWSKDGKEPDAGT